MSAILPPPPFISSETPVKSGITTLLILILMLFTSTIQAQSQQWWRTNGNTPQTSDYLGTSNNFPLIIKTNNIERIRIDANGLVGLGITNPQYLLDVNGRARFRYNMYCDSLLQCSSLKVNNLSGSGNALLASDAQGNVTRLNFSGSASDVLTGNGNWASINSLLPAQAWQSSGQNIFYSNGYVGIGTTHPLFSLDVVGDVRVSNNIYVGGGIIISDKVNAFTEVTAPKVVASEAKSAKLVTDSIMMDSTRAIYGNTTIQGAVKVATDADVLGDLKVNNKLTIQGNAKFNGLLTATQGIMFNDSVGLKVVNTSSSPSSSGGNSTTLYFGKGLPPPPPVNPCTNPSQLPVFQIGGAAQLIWNNTAMNLWTDGSNSIIDHQGNGNLLINYYCGKDVIVGNVNSGNLIAQQKVGIGTSTPQKLLHINNNNGDASILIYSTNGKSELWSVNGTYGYGIGIDASGKGHIWKDINNPGEVMTFDVNGNIGVGTSNPQYKLDVNGKVRIGVQKTTDHLDAMLVIDGKGVCKDFWVTMQNWADDEFEKNNTLEDLVKEYEFAMKNKHFKNIPSEKEIIENGLNVNAMLEGQMRLIEKLFKYIYLMNKEIIQLKEKNKD